MAPAETSAAFLRIAHCDLRAAMAMADSSVFEEDTWGFYLEQATEKSLKAWLLVLAREQPPFTHNLRLLL
ncbi:HEPN domain-containing protein [Synechococcus sp. 1G10]|uniref:HEPN domain-containing protein n=1 Tax=Synechococcus sp. 1G10 TaxID=2025605 RepID=UPI001E618821|nr:HEPN domain-containing protein [Synechococcus sp. 1G10]